MKKLKPWQIVLLVIFYPVGIVYLIVWLSKRNNNQSDNANNCNSPVMHLDTDKLTVVNDFHTKVVGVTFNNDDGTSRQAIVKACKPGDDIIFKPVPTTEYPDAVGVFNKQGQQLGHLSQGVADEIKNEYGYNPMSVTVSNITGGGDYNYGCNLHIVIYAKQ